MKELPAELHALCSHRKCRRIALSFFSLSFLQHVQRLLNIILYLVVATNRLNGFDLRNQKALCAIPRFAANGDSGARAVPLGLKRWRPTPRPNSDFITGTHWASGANSDRTAPMKTVSTTTGGTGIVWVGSELPQECHLPFYIAQRPCTVRRLSTDNPPLNSGGSAVFQHLDLIPHKIASFQYAK